MQSTVSLSRFNLMITFTNLLSCLRVPVGTNTWHAAIGLFWNVSMGPLVLHFTKYCRCILYSLLVLIITCFSYLRYHYTVRNYVWLHCFVSLWTQLISKETFWIKFLINVVHFLTYVCFFINYCSSNQWY